MEKAFAEVEGLPACRALPNSGRPSLWYLSIVICPSRPEDITPEEIQTPLRLIGLTAVNPQSNWPKNCDEIYLKINRTRIWEQPQEICRGDRIELDIPLEEGSTIELWEHDASGDDNLGTIATKPSICRLPAVVEGKTAIGDWRYVFEFAQ